MSNSDSKDDMTALVVRSAHDLATRSSLVLRGLRDISTGFQEDSFKSVDDHALEFFHQDKFEEAIGVCTAGLDANPKDECLWLIKGMCFSKQEKYDELLKCAVPLLEIDGKNPTYWYLAARVLHRLSKFEDELKYWRKLMQIDPQYGGAWKGIGDCLFTLRKYQEAVEAFDSALKVNPSDEYCQSRRDDAISALLEGGEWTPTSILSLLGWYSESFDGRQLAPYTETRHLSLICQIRNISDHERLIGKQMSMYRRSKGTREMKLFAEALILEDATFRLPLRIAPHSEVDPISVELTWACPLDKTDPDCVEELFDMTWETVARDDEYGTVIKFVG